MAAVAPKAPIGASNPGMVDVKGGEMFPTPTRTSGKELALSPPRSAEGSETTLSDVWGLNPKLARRRKADELLPAATTTTTATAKAAGDSKTEAAKAAKSEKDDAPSSARNNAMWRKEHAPATWVAIDKPAVFFGPSVNFQRKLKTIKNINTDKRTLSVGVSSFSKFSKMKAMMNGGVLKDQRYAMVPLAVEPHLHVPALSTADGIGKSPQDLFGPCEEIITGLTIDGIEAAQLRELLNSHTTLIGVVAPPKTTTATSADATWTRKVASECSAIIGENVATLSQVHRSGSHPFRVVQPAAESFTGALATQLPAGAAAADSRKVLYLNTISWSNPTSDLYPNAPEQTYEDILLSDAGRKFHAVVVRHRAWWLEEIGSTARARIAQVWSIHAQLRSELTERHAATGPKSAEFAALMQANDAAIAALNVASNTDVETDHEKADLALQKLGEAAEACHGEAAGGLKKLQAELSRVYKNKAKTSLQVRIALFAIGARAKCPEDKEDGVYTYVLVRRRLPAAAAAAKPAAAAAAAAAR